MVACCGNQVHGGIERDRRPVPHHKPTDQWLRLRVVLRRSAPSNRSELRSRFANGSPPGP